MAWPPARAHWFCTIAQVLTLILYAAIDRYQPLPDVRVAILCVLLTAFQGICIKKRAFTVEVLGL